MEKRRGNVLVVLLGAVLIISAGAAGYFWWQKNQSPSNSPSVLTWEECLKIPGAKQLMTYPGQCVTPEGRQVTQPLSNDEKKKLQTPSINPAAAWKTYTDSAHNFSIMYPATWSVMIDNDSSIIFSDPQLPVPSPAVGWISIVKNWSLEGEKKNSVLRMTYVDSKGNVTGYGPVINQGIYDIQNTTIAGVDGKAYKFTTQVGLTNQYVAITKGETTYKIGYGLEGQDQEQFSQALSTFKFLN